MLSPRTLAKSEAVCKLPYRMLHGIGAIDLARHALLDPDVHQVGNITCKPSAYLQISGAHEALPSWVNFHKFQLNPGKPCSCSEQATSVPPPASSACWHGEASHS